MKLSVLRLLPWLAAAAAPAGAIAGPTSSAGEWPSYEISLRLGASPGTPGDGAIAASPAGSAAHLPWLPAGAAAWNFAAPADLTRSLAVGWPLCAVPPVSIKAGIDSVDAAVWMAKSAGAVRPRKPLEGEDREIELFPSLITFFCNPYRLDAGGRSGGSGICFRSDTRPEIDVGLMGRLGEDVRVALFSTLSTLAFTEELLSGDRKAVESEALTHRFALLLSVSPAKDLFLGAAGGAEVVDRPRSYVFELLFEARLQF